MVEFWIALVEMWPIKSLVPTRVENSGYVHDQWSAEEFHNNIGVALLLLDVQMKLF